MPPCTLYKGRGAGPGALSGRHFSLTGRVTNNKTSGFICTGLMMAEVLGSVISDEEGNILEKPSVLLCGQKVHPLKGGQRGRCCTHAVFVFSPENIWDLRRASQRNPSIAFPLVPHPPFRFEPARPPHICIKMKSRGSHMSLPYPSGCRGTIFIFVERVCTTCSDMREVLS